jgi:hypothetical protein
LLKYKNQKNPFVFLTILHFFCVPSVVRSKTKNNEKAVVVMSFNRVCLLYLYLAVAMVLCFVLGNVTAHSQKANTSPTPAVKPPFVKNLDEWRQKQFFNGGSYMPLAIPQETERFPLMNYFASGDAFYLDMESFEPTANGKLNYKIVG